MPSATKLGKALYCLFIGVVANVVMAWLTDAPGWACTMTGLILFTVLVHLEET